MVHIKCGNLLCFLVKVEDTVKSHILAGDPTKDANLGRICGQICILIEKLGANALNLNQLQFARSFGDDLLFAQLVLFEEKVASAMMEIENDYRNQISETCYLH